MGMGVNVLDDIDRVIVVRVIQTLLISWDFHYV